MNIILLETCLNVSHVCKKISLVEWLNDEDDDIDLYTRFSNWNDGLRDENKINLMQENTKY